MDRIEYVCIDILYILFNPFTGALNSFVSSDSKAESKLCGRSGWMKKWFGSLVLLGKSLF